MLLRDNRSQRLSGSGRRAAECLARARLFQAWILAKIIVQRVPLYEKEWATMPARMIEHDNRVFMIFANGVGVDDEIRTRNAMVRDPYSRILSETWKADNDMMVCDIDKTLLERATGRERISARRPEMYGLLTKPTGLEKHTHILKSEE